MDGGSSPPISTAILNALFGVVFILLYQSVLNWCVIPVLFQRNSPPFKGKGESPKWRQHLPLSPDNLVHPPTSACDPHSTPLLAFPWHKTQLLNRQSRPSSRQAHVIPILRLCWHFPGTKLNSLTANLVHPLQTILPFPPQKSHPSN